MLRYNERPGRMLWGIRAGGSCATVRREPCQAGNRAALSGLRRAPQGTCPLVCPRECGFVFALPIDRLLGGTLPGGDSSLGKCVAKGGGEIVSGALPEMAATDIFGRLWAAGDHHRAEE